MAVRTASQTGNWNSTSTWGNANVPTIDDDVNLDGFTITVDDYYSASCLSIWDQYGTGDLTLSIGSSFTCVGSITDIPIYINGTDCTITAPALVVVSLASPLLTINQNCSVTGFADARATGSCEAIQNNGTINDWHGVIYGPTAGSNCTVNNVTGATITKWTGNVIGGSYSIPALYNDGTISYWNGHVYGGSVYYTPGVFNCYNGGIISNWHGNVYSGTAGYTYGLQNYGTINSWYGDVIAGTYAISNAALCNSGSIGVWFGNVVGNGAVGVINSNGFIVNWYGDVSTIGDNAGVYQDSNGIIELWFGNVSGGNANYTSYGVYNSTGSLIKCWCGDITAGTAADGIYDRGGLTNGFGNLNLLTATYGYYPSAVNSTTVEWLTTIATPSAAISGIGATLNVDAATCLAVWNIFMFGGDLQPYVGGAYPLLVDGYAITRGKANQLPADTGRIVDPSEVIVGNSYYPPGEYVAGGGGTTTDPGIEKVLTGTAYSISGSSKVGTLPYTRKHGAMR